MAVHVLDEELPDLLLSRGEHGGDASWFADERMFVSEG